MLQCSNTYAIGYSYKAWVIQINVLVYFVCSLTFSIRALLNNKKDKVVWSHGANGTLHDDVTKWIHSPHYWPFVRGIHRSPMNCPHKGQWRGALMFSLNCAWINGWVNNREAGDFKRHRAIMTSLQWSGKSICLFRDGSRTDRYTGRVWPVERDIRLAI